MRLKTICVLLFLGACFSLYYGSGMLLLFPATPGEGYFAAWRILYGVLPTLLSAVLLVVVGWLWTRTGSAVGLERAIGNSFSWAIGAVLLFWIGVLIIAGIRQG